MSDFFDLDKYLGINIFEIKFQDYLDMEININFKRPYRIRKMKKLIDYIELKIPFSANTVVSPYVIYRDGMNIDQYRFPESRIGEEDYLQ